MERVIFRKEKNPYCDSAFLAIFPDDPANPGFYGCVPFHFCHDCAVFEPYCEIDTEYMYKSRIVHKGTETAWKCMDAIKNHFDSDFTMIEKIMR